MARSKIISVLFSFLFLFAFTPLSIFSEEVTDEDFGWSLDVPEGYSIIDSTPDGMSVLFQHDRLPVSLVMKMYPHQIYNTPETALRGSLQRLKATTEGIDSFTWRYTDCSICTFSTKALSAKGSCGWAVSVNLPEKETILTLLCYADADKADDVQQFIISTVNSLAIDRGSLFSPGIITTYAFPCTEEKKIELNIKGKTISSTVKTEDSEAAQYVVDCEWAVLKFYAGNEKWKEAWTRYYKLIFRDSYNRLSKVAFDISNVFMPEAIKINKKEPNVVINEILLDWVQNFNYDKIDNSADYCNVIDVISGCTSDCDSRSMVMCCIMEQLGTKAQLFISNEYKHAVYGLDLDIQGAKIEVEGKWYLLNETTAQDVKPGLIARDFSETEKWIPVVLP